MQRLRDPRVLIAAVIGLAGPALRLVARNPVAADASVVARRPANRVAAGRARE